MKPLLPPCHPQARYRLSLYAATLLVVTAGCASPGPPHPPSLNLPEVVKDLSAQRIGDQVILHWTTPPKTTDHIPTKGQLSAEICRIAVPSATCTQVERLPVHAGPSQTTETLPQALASAPPSLLAYRIQIFNAAGRSAGLSSEAFTLAGTAPPPVEQLRAVPSRSGVTLEWQPQDTTARVQLTRDLITPAPPASKPAPAATRLQTPEGADPGGTLDHSAKKDETYRYTAQRIQSITLGGHTLELRSPISPPVTIAFRDIFPPAVPTGLEAVPGGATPADRSIDLSWTPDTDLDLAGYSVYRQEVTSTGELAPSATRLNSTPIAGPAYRDQTALPGHRYSYRVTAVDTTGNESAPSAAVQENLREQ
jgi:hypothetical protein